MNSQTSLVLAASAMMIAAPVAAQTALPATAPTQTKAADPMSEMVCQKQEVVGSRLATRRVCMTRQQWQEQRLLDRQDTERAQIHPDRSTPGG